MKTNDDKITRLEEEIASYWIYLKEKHKRKDKTVSSMDRRREKEK